MKKINIGLLIREFENLSDTEFRIYEKLLDSKYVKIEVLLKDGRKKVKKKITRFLNFDVFSKILFVLINKIDLFFSLQDTLIINWLLIVCYCVILHYYFYQNLEDLELLL